MKRIIDKSFYIQLCIGSIIALIILLFRSRYGVDLTDETWYVGDPYWVAKGSIPYVNNWTQASGFTLPLFVLYSAFLKITGGNVGIVLFSRILYCIWRTLIITLSFIFLKKAQMDIPGILAMPIIIFNPHQLYTINYNSIGLTYIFFIFSIIAFSVSEKTELTRGKKFVIGVICGLLIGRSVIGTPATVAACVVIFAILIFKRRFLTVKGYITGGILAFLAVVGFCCIKGGIKNFIIGIQFFIRDINYYDSIEKHGVASSDSSVYLLKYFYHNFPI